jgi:flagellar biosynthesis protein FlhG
VIAKPRIIPVAAGKGGVGKSLLSANISIALAEAGHSVIAVDLDLGASNLHSHLGIANLQSGLGDFLKGEELNFAELPIQTEYENLKMITGDGRSYFMGNINYAQKAKVITQLRRLRADYIVLDLGAGSNFTTLDFFGLSDTGLLVTQPEFPSILNMFSFLKNFLLRRIDREFSQDIKTRELLSVIGRRKIQEQPTIAMIRKEVKRHHPEAAIAIDRICSDCRPRIVFNMARKPTEIALTKEMDRVAQKSLSISLGYYGFVYQDPAVHHSIFQRQVLLRDYPDCIAASEIRRIATRIINFWDRDIKDSASRIEARAIKTYQSFYSA